MIELGVAMSGSDPLSLLKAVANLNIAGTGAPDRLQIDGEEILSQEDWFEFSSVTEREKIIATWQDVNSVIYNAPATVELSQSEYVLDFKKWLPDFAGLPFELLSTTAMHQEWYEDEALNELYTSPCFDRYHCIHGWICGFRGEGHRRLVSRRWLDFGPWRTIRGPHDTTFLQFHDLNADTRTALIQAVPGHERIGESHGGGFIPSDDFGYTFEIEGLYQPADRSLNIVVNGREVPQGEMLEACMIRLWQNPGFSGPVNDVNYIFVHEKEAEAHLHELWLRELGCWLVNEAGDRVRLDEDYTPPPPDKPQWVKDLEAREST